MKTAMLVLTVAAPLAFALPITGQPPYNQRRRQWVRSNASIPFSTN